jgi:hypothetical protein
MEELGIKFLSALLASVSAEFRDCSFSHIMLDWRKLVLSACNYLHLV